jgi:hypothetical protein
MSLSALTQLLDVWLSIGQLQSKIGVVFILFYLFLFVYLNSPADHLAHRRGPPVVRGPQVGKRWSKHVFLPESKTDLQVNVYNLCSFP